MLTWFAVAALAAGSFGQRMLGMFVGRHGGIGKRQAALLAALPVAIICALAAQLTFSTDGELTFDARAVGVAAAVVCTWRRLPAFVVVLVAAATTAVLRLWWA